MSALSLARRWLASEISDNNSTRELREACQQGLYDDDPRFPDLLKMADRQITAMNPRSSHLGTCLKPPPIV